jgi:hypothetical protein
MNTPYKINGELFYPHEHPTDVGYYRLITGSDTIIDSGKIVSSQPMMFYAIIDGNRWVTIEEIKVAYVIGNFRIHPVT